MENKITTAAEWQAALSAATTPGKADTLSRFFKTGKGEYGGRRQICRSDGARQQANSQTNPRRPAANRSRDARQRNPRAPAVGTSVARGALPEGAQRPRRETPIAQFYLTHTNGINNWDLVDLSAPYIYRRPDNGRQRPHATPSRQRQPVGTTHSRRVDNAANPQPPVRHRPPQRSSSAPTPPRPDAESQRLDAPRNGQTRHFHTVAFFDLHAATMPRTTLRYAVERLAPEQKKHYMEMKKHIQQFIKIKLQKKFRDFVAISEKYILFAQNFKKAERRLYK